MRWALPTIFSLALLSSGAAAQSLGIDPNSHRPTLGFPLQQKNDTDTYKRLPYRDLATEIHIELASDALYDFDRAEVQSNAADYFQQIANLIFEHANGPVHIECRSDRGQKFAERCAQAISQRLIVQERLTKVKFTTVGASVPPPATPHPDNPFAPKPVNLANIMIVFAKK